MHGIEQRRRRAERQVRARREWTNRRLRDLVSGKSAWPHVRFVDRDPAEIVAAIRTAPGGTIYVSCHTLGYYQLLRLIEFSPVPVNCVVAQNIIRTFEQFNFVLPEGVVLSPFLSKDAIRHVSRGTESLFIMADVMAPTADNCCIAMAGHVFRYSVTWAQMCCRMKLNVVPIFLRDAGDHVEVEMRWLPWKQQSVAKCARAVFAAFEEFLAGDFRIWENFPFFREFGFPLLDTKQGMTDELVRVLAYLGMCDLSVAKVLQQYLSDRVSVAGPLPEIGARLRFNGGRFNLA